MDKRLILKNMWYQIKKNKRFMLLLAVSLSIFYPLAMMLIYSGNDYDSITIVVSGFKIANLIFFGIVTTLVPLIIFRYMMSRKDLDVYHALPIKSEDLFISNFFATALIVIIPEIVVWIAGYFVEIYLGLDPSMINMLLEILIIVAYTPIILFASTLALNNIGTMFDSYIYSVVLQLLPFIALLVIQLYGDQNLFTSTSILTDQVLTAICYPFAFIKATLFQYGDSVYTWGMFIWAALGWLGIILNRYLYAKRRVENVEQPQINRWFTPIVLSLVTILVIMIALYSYNYGYSQRSIEFIFPLVTIMTIYLVFDAILHRGFSHLFKGVITFTVLLAISIGLIFGLSLVNGFNFDYTIPKAEEIEKVYITSYTKTIVTTINGYEQQYNKIERHEPDLRGYYSIFEDSEDIEKIVEFNHESIETFYEYFGDKGDFRKHFYVYSEDQKNQRYLDEFVSNYKLNGVDAKEFVTEIGWDEGNEIGNNLFYVRLIYELEDGDRVIRDYEMPFDWTYPLYEMVKGQ